PGAFVLGGIAAAGLAQVAQVRTLVRWNRRERDPRFARAALFACIPALAPAAPLMVVALALPMPGAQHPGYDLLCGVLAATMAALALEAGRLERRLLGEHQVLGAQLRQATAHLQRGPLADPLTGLLSRHGIESALRKAALEAEGQGQRITLLSIGLD